MQQVSGVSYGEPILEQSAPLARDFLQVARTFERGGVLPVGWLWDVVVTAAGLGGHALLRSVSSAQPGGTGPVIAVPDQDLLFWLVWPGTVRSWANPYGLCHGMGTRILVPPWAQVTPPHPYWTRRASLGRLTDPSLLDRELRVAFLGEQPLRLRLRPPAATR